MLPNGYSRAGHKQEVISKRACACCLSVCAGLAYEDINLPGPTADVVLNHKTVSVPGLKSLPCTIFFFSILQTHAMYRELAFSAVLTSRGARLAPPQIPPNLQPGPEAFGSPEQTSSFL